MIKNILATVLANDRFNRNDAFERNAVRSVGATRPTPAVTFQAVR